MSETTVLVVDDEEKIVRAHERWLQDEYDVRKAYGGEEALETIDETVDVALLDRMMPDLDGDEVVDEIRDRQAVQDCFLVMVSAAEPDFDIVELGFDDYVVKPAGQDILKSTIEDALKQEGVGYDEKIRELYSLSSKRAVLKEHKTERELEDSDEKDRLDERIVELREQINDGLSDVDEYNYDELL
jgi:DNA-binding response OmpR family regulator